MSYKLLAPNYYSRLKNVIFLVGRGKNVLNVGCGDGYYNRFLKDRFDFVVGVDVNINDLRIAEAVNGFDNVIYLLNEDKKLPFEDNIFDEIICVDVLEHVDDDKCFVNELYRVLRNNGKLIVTVPNQNYPFSYDPINYILEKFGKHLPIGLWGFGHKRLYMMDELKNLFDEFKVLDERRMLHFFSGIFEQYYIVNLLQPFTKSNRMNREDFEKKNIEKLKKRADKNPAKFLLKARDFIMNIDHKLFKNSKKSLGILLYLEK